MCVHCGGTRALEIRSSTYQRDQRGVSDECVMVLTQSFSCRAVGFARRAVGFSNARAVGFACGAAGFSHRGLLGSHSELLGSHMQELLGTRDKWHRTERNADGQAGQGHRIGWSKDGWVGMWIM